MSGEFVTACLTLGAVAGLLGGALGIGGGVIIVPALVYLYATLDIGAPLDIRLAIGTSLATIVFTSTTAVYAQYRRGAIRWDIVRRWTPFVLLGSFASGYVAELLPGVVLRGFIGAFLLLAALIMLARWTPPPHRQLPGHNGTAATGLTAGLGAGLAGIGGGNIIVPLLVYFNIAMKNATATSSALGLPIALFGALSFISAGRHTPGLPAFSLGYIYLPAMAAVAVTSTLTAPLGVKLAHCLPAGRLKQAFGLLLCLVSLRMLSAVIAAPG